MLITSHNPRYSVSTVQSTLLWYKDLSDVFVDRYPKILSQLGALLDVMIFKNSATFFS